MNKEFRRSLLGALFFFSCFMLWNQWLIHTGQKPLFSFGKQAAQPVVGGTATLNGRTTAGTVAAARRLETLARESDAAGIRRELPELLAQQGKLAGVLRKARKS